MAVLEREFHCHEDGSHYETFYSLAVDTETGEVFVIYESITPNGKQQSSRREIGAVLREQNTAATKLRDLIGSLVTEVDHA